MTNKDFGLSNKSLRIAEALAKRMPHLEFAVWDLSDFLPVFHNVKRTMVFLECEEAARSEVIHALAANPESRDYPVYSGERKPKALNEEWANATSTKEIRNTIVVVARKDFKETDTIKGNMRAPWLERKLVDLLVYSVRGWLPLSVEEARDAFIAWLKRRETRITVLQRYATRRYLGWFLDITLYRLSKKGEISAATIDPRYLELGERYERALKKVTELES